MMVINVEHIETAISIHAPHAGCDIPARGEVVSGMLFQSTHPMRGATTVKEVMTLSEAAISIHAPHAGCDAETPWL